jgi:PDZ domain-containing protein
VGKKTTLPSLQVGGHAAGCLGFQPDQLYATKGAPFPVTIDSDGIVGPSAGLAFTLGLIEKLDTADLTAGHKIAATGTMSVDGMVGDVGGVAQKTVAVRNAGATVFFVPPQEYKVALAHAGSSLHVYAVTSARQAVADLEKLGGRLVGAKRH